MRWRAAVLQLINQANVAPCRENIDEHAEHDQPGANQNEIP
jgi:hypothetical protein